VADLSISKAWDETKATLASDGTLLMTVAAALFLLPQVLVGVATGAGADAAQSPPALGLPMAIAALIGLVGQISIAWLAIGSSVSVGEAIRHGLRRLLPFLGAILLVVATMALIFILAALILMVAGVIDRPLAGVEPRPRDIAMVLLVALVPMLFVSVRLIPTSAVAAAETVGAVGILKRSWQLTRGHFPRLLGFMAIFIVGMLVVIVAVGPIIGLLAIALFGSTEPFSLGALTIALVTALIQAAVVVVYVVMVARIYVQLAGDRSAEATVPISGT